MTPQFTDHEKAEAATREAKMRRRVYPRWVEAGRMKEAEANRQIALMEEIAAEYERYAAHQEAKERLL